MRHYTKDNFRLTESVGFHLVKARNLIVSEMDAALKDLDISGQQMGIMLMLRANGTSTPFELSKMLGVDSGVMTRTLDKLETLGMLTRTRNDADRRVVNLELTEAGRAVALRITEIAPDVLNARLACFTPQEFDELRRLLRKFLSD